MLFDAFSFKPLKMPQEPVNVVTVIVFTIALLVPTAR